MLHIHNGDSSAETAKNANIPGEHLAWREALICGPAPAGLTREEFRRVRAQHLAEAYGETIEDCEKQLRAQEERLSRFSDHDEVVFWFEHDLFCQVHLIYLLNWFAQQELAGARLSLICIDSFPGVKDFRGLGQLNAEQLATLFPARSEIKEKHLELGAQAWAAFSSSDPTTLEKLIKGNTSHLPFLRDALRKHLERFPSVRNGLGRNENLALKLIAAGCHGFGEVFAEFGAGESAYGFGDAQVFVELKRLATASVPLLRMANAASSALNGQEMLKSSFYLTEHGKAVLEGDEDFVKLNGIDLWLGGVHLQGNEAAWRWDEVAQTLACKSST